jgi:hypothetical protein
MGNAVPKGQLTDDGELPSGPLFNNHGPIYRLTDSGWAAIQRAHMWVVVGVVLTLASLFAAAFLK